MHALLQTESGQLIGVLLILAGAVGYLTIYYRRKFKGETGDCCGSSCGIPLARKSAQEPGDPKAPPPANRPQQFIPAENLADLAARRRREQDEKKAKH